MVLLFGPDVISCSFWGVAAELPFVVCVYRYVYSYTGRCIAIFIKWELLFTLVWVGLCYWCMYFTCKRLYTQPLLLFMATWLPKRLWICIVGDPRSLEVFVNAWKLKMKQNVEWISIVFSLCQPQNGQQSQCTNTTIQFSLSIIGLCSTGLNHTQHWYIASALVHTQKSS